MIRRYQALVFVPSRYAPHSDAVVVGTYRTAESAARRTERVLAKHETLSTRAGCSTRAWHGSVWDRKRGAQVGESIDAPERLALSVGEVGWW
jgi:hypothetical protein